MKIKTTRIFLERVLEIYKEHPLCNDTYVAFSIVFHKMLEEGTYSHMQISIMTHNARLRIKDAFMRNYPQIESHFVHGTMGLQPMVGLINEALLLPEEFCKDKTIYPEKK